MRLTGLRPHGVQAGQLCLLLDAGDEVGHADQPLRPRKRAAYAGGAPQKQGKPICQAAVAAGECVCVQGAEVQGCWYWMDLVSHPAEQVRPRNQAAAADGSVLEDAQNVAEGCAGGQLGLG